MTQCCFCLAQNEAVGDFRDLVGILWLRTIWGLDPVRSKSIVGNQDSVALGRVTVFKLEVTCAQDTTTLLH
jgi:hypothetical protein